MLGGVRAERLLRWWLIGLNVGLIGAGALLAGLGSPRALFLIVRLVTSSTAPSLRGANLGDDRESESEALVRHRFADSGPGQVP